MAESLNLPLTSIQICQEKINISVPHPSRSFIAFFLLLGVLAWWPGDAVAKSIAPAASEPLTRANNFGRPVLTPEQVLQGVLRLAEAVPKQQQLTPEMVKETTGIWLKHAPFSSDPQRYVFRGQLTEPDWFYNFVIFTDGYPKRRVFRLNFYPGNGLDQDATFYDPVCRFPLVAVDRALHKVGYTRRRGLDNQLIFYRNGEAGVLIVRILGSRASCVRFMRVSLPDPGSKGQGND